jgi:hypothetical protein
MQEPRPIPFSRLFSIWWLRTWRGALGGAVAVAPFALGFYLLQRAGVQSPLLRLAEQIASLIIGAGIAWVVSGMGQGKRYLDFRIALLPQDADCPELSVTSSRVLAFWWQLVWRVTPGAGAIGVAAAFAARCCPAQRGSPRSLPCWPSWVGSSGCCAWRWPSATAIFASC